MAPEAAAIPYAPGGGSLRSACALEGPLTAALPPAGGAWARRASEHRVRARRRGSDRSGQDGNWCARERLAASEEGSGARARARRPWGGAPDDAGRRRPRNPCEDGHRGATGGLRRTPCRIFRHRGGGGAPFSRRPRARPVRHGRYGARSGPGPRYLRASETWMATVRAHPPRRERIGTDSRGNTAGPVRLPAHAGAGDTPIGPTEWMRRPGASGSGGPPCAP